MAKIPGTFYRVTTHKKPRYQLYIPGFNPANSCWLDGSWVTVKKDDYDERHKAHQKLFKKALKGRGKQHYRDAATTLTMLTEAQRMAYEHYSGQARFDVRYENGVVGPVGVEMSGNRLKKGQAKWMRESGMKIIRFTTTTGKTVDALEGFDVPEDLIHEDQTPIDPWKEVVAQNIQNQVDMFYGCFEEAVGVPVDFCHQMAVGILIQKEESIIRQEWNAQVGRGDGYDDIPRDIKHYKGMRAKAEEVMGEAFAAQYEQSRGTHNQCARSNLGDSGVLFCFVLPKFNMDGTHEPWGSRDVPWGAV
jgi:hypothetical protein